MEGSQPQVNTGSWNRGGEASLQLPEGWKPCPYLGFSLLILISDFWSPCYFKPTRIWQFIAEVTEAQGDQTEQALGWSQILGQKTHPVSEIRKSASQTYRQKKMERRGGTKVSFLMGSNAFQFSLKIEFSSLCSQERIDLDTGMWFHLSTDWSWGSCMLPNLQGCRQSQWLSPMPSHEADSSRERLCPVREKE